MRLNISTDSRKGISEAFGIQEERLNELGLAVSKIINENEDGSVTGVLKKACELTDVPEEIVYIVYTIGAYVESIKTEQIWN